MSMKRAIENMCFQCIYDPLSNGSKHKQVEDCTSPDCALFDYRPVSGALKEQRKQERIAEMTDDERLAYQRKVEIARERLQRRESP